METNITSTKQKVWKWVKIILIIALVVVNIVLIYNSCVKGILESAFSGYLVSSFTDEQTDMLKREFGIPQEVSMTPVYFYSDPVIQDQSATFIFLVNIADVQEVHRLLSDGLWAVNEGGYANELLGRQYDLRYEGRNASTSMREYEPRIYCGSLLVSFTIEKDMLAFARSNGKKQSRPQYKYEINI